MKEKWLCPLCGKDFHVIQTYQGGKRMMKIDCPIKCKVDYITPEKYHELIEKRKDSDIRSS